MPKKKKVGITVLKTQRDVKVKGNPCYLNSSSPAPKYVKYGDEEIRISPFQKNVYITDETLLGALPQGVSKLKQS